MVFGDRGRGRKGRDNYNNSDGNGLYFWSTNEVTVHIASFVHMYLSTTIAPLDFIILITEFVVHKLSHRTKVLMVLMTS